MPSRKRAKGKERKANKSIASHCNWAALALVGEKNMRIRCNHGCTYMPSSQHPAALLVDNIISALGNEKMRCLESLQLSFETKPHLWNNANNRKRATEIVTSIGVNFILGGNDIEYAKVLGNAILQLIHYDGKGDLKTAVYGSAPEAQVLNGGLERDIVRFYIRHTTCSCLKKRYRQLRWQQKVGELLYFMNEGFFSSLVPNNFLNHYTGECNNCLKTVLRSDLMMCGGCRTTQFCSRECQKEDWPDHKQWCDDVVSWKCNKAA